MIKGTYNGTLWQHCQFSMNVPLQRAFLLKNERIKAFPRRFQMDFKAQSILLGVEGLIKLVQEADQRGDSAAQLEADVCAFLGVAFAPHAVDYIVAVRLFLSGVELDDKGVIIDQDAIGAAVQAHLKAADPVPVNTASALVETAPTALSQPAPQPTTVVAPHQVDNQANKAESGIKRDVKPGVKKDWKSKYGGAI